MKARRVSGLLEQLLSNSSSLDSLTESVSDMGLLCPRTHTPNAPLRRHIPLQQVPWLKGSKMWTPQTVKWPELVVDATKARKLRFFVGNGLSRLSNAYGWYQLFTDHDTVEVFKTLGIDVHQMLHRGVSVLELGELLMRKRKDVWQKLLEKLRSSNEQLKPNLVHEVLEILVTGSQLSKTKVTTNVDGLLGITNMVYLHGSPLDVSTWIFTESAYREKLAITSEKLKESLADGTTVFIGYGHSYEDFDIWMTFERSAEMLLYSLVPSHELSPLLAFRLNKHSISQVEYVAARNPSPDERQLAIAKALADLCEQAGIDLPTNTARKLQSLETAVTDQFSHSVLAIGLAGVNTLATPDRFPINRRESIRANVRREAGGPALIVCRILQTCGICSFLVSKIATDADGQLVLRGLDQVVANKERSRRILLDYVEESADPGFQTWNSYILEDPEPPYQRVFIDTAIERSKMELSQATIDRLMSDMDRFSPRVLYFDKFLRESVRGLLLSTRFRLSEKLWTVYETGSDGDRFYKAPDGTEDEYFLEELISGSANIVVSSFRFARDYLASTMPKKLCKRLRFREILIGEAENKIIEIILRDGDTQDKFLKYVFNGAAKWLRSHPFQLCVITLHQAGCYWLLLTADGKFKWNYCPGTSKIGRLHTTSAGDVFRGAFVAALAKAREALSEARLADPAVLDAICSFANLCAAAKVCQSTVEATLPQISKEFDRFCDCLAEF